jgi:hypothetical protein
MIGKKKWYAELDVNRISWCLLYTEVSEGGNPEGWISDYEVGVGNSQELLETQRDSVDGPGREKELLRDIAEFLGDLQKEEPVIITPDNRTLRHLRTRFLRRDVEVGFHGMRHAPLQRLYTTYFTYEEDKVRFGSLDMEEPPDGMVVQEMWKAYRKLGTYVPRTAVKGEPL